MIPSSSRYSSHASSSSTCFTPLSQQEKNDRVIQQILGAIGRDPSFSSAFQTACESLTALRSFFNDGGNPAMRIPELRIGHETVRNISCLELAYRLSIGDFEGLEGIDWDRLEASLVRLFTEVLNVGFENIDRFIEASLTLDEVVELIRCVFICDPYTEKYETGNRIFNLVSKFLDSDGSPTVSVENVRLHGTLLNKVTIWELVYFLWQPSFEKFHPSLPYNSLTRESYFTDTRKNGELRCKEMEARFGAIIDRCVSIVNAMLVENKLADEDFLPLIRCAIGFCDGPHDWISKKSLERFLFLMEYFVRYNVNPNLVFSFIEIGEIKYKDPTCFQVVYLVWKHSKASWDAENDQKFQKIFNDLLRDPRTDLTWRFSEYTLDLNLQHFTDRSKPYWYYDPYANSYELDEREGYSLERITIAHYAAVIGDYVTLRSLLDREPRLVTAVCCLTRGKASLLGDRYNENECWIWSPLRPASSRSDPVLQSSLENDDKLAGPIEIYYEYPNETSRGEDRNIYRITDVTLLHLAARTGHTAILACLGSEHPNLAAVDSDGRIPQHYLERSLKEMVVKSSRRAATMLKALVPVTKFVGALPKVHLIIFREGYDLHYNTSKKVADFVRQRLGRDSFGDAKRTNHRWVNNLDIPELNRVIDNDYKASGYDRGHLVPAEDATHSDQTMGDTFHPENAVPQNPNLNSGVWSRLEAHVRTLAQNHDLVEIFTGPLFLPQLNLQGRVITYPLIGLGDVHVPTHLFKIIFVHDRITRAEVYIVPNETQPPKTKFSVFKCRNSREGIEFIQRYSGILFDQWMYDRPTVDL